MAGPRKSGQPLQSLYLLLAKQPSQIFANISPGGAGGGASSVLSEWRGNLAMMLLNRTPNDMKVMTMLGDKLWAAHGNPRAAHLCYLAAGLSPHVQPRGSTRMAVIGADHMKNPRTFMRNAEAMQLTEAFE
eukprot:jgi/Bigna1/79987/fgenesh1_pg.66_\